MTRGSTLCCWCGSGIGEITSAALFGSHQGGQVVDAQDASGNCAPGNFTGKTDTGFAQLAQSVAPWLQERGGDPALVVRWSSATLPLKAGPPVGLRPTVRLAAFQQPARLVAATDGCMFASTSSRRGRPSELGRKGTHDVVKAASFPHTHAVCRRLWRRKCSWPGEQVNSWARQALEHRGVRR